MGAVLRMMQCIQFIRRISVRVGFHTYRLWLAKIRFTHSFVRQHAKTQQPHTLRRTQTRQSAKHAPRRNARHTTAPAAPKEQSAVARLGRLRFACGSTTLACASLAQSPLKTLLWRQTAWPDSERPERDHARLGRETRAIHRRLIFFLENVLDDVTRQDQYDPF